MFRLFFISFLLFSFAAGAQNYLPSDSGSRVHFVIKNFGINTGGDLTGIKGEIHFDPENIATAIFDVTVSAITIDTDNKKRDNHLRSDDFLDAEKFPEIRIKSLQISKTNKTEEGFYYFTGELTIRDVTQPLSFPFKVEKVNEDYFFTGDFEIDRTDFKVGKGSTVMGNKVKVSLKVFAKK